MHARMQARCRHLQREVEEAREEVARCRAQNNDLTRARDELEKQVSRETTAYGLAGSWYGLCILWMMGAQPLGVSAYPL